MKIKGLSIRNFRSHRGTEMELDRINFVIGPNASGKSSIASAIEWALTGACDQTDEGGKGAEQLIRSGEDGALVEMDARAQSNDLLFERHKTAKSQELRIHGVSLLPLADAQKKLIERVGCANEVLRAALNSSRFFDLDANAQKKLLSQVLADEGILVPKDLYEPIQATIGPIRLTPDDYVRLTITQLDALHKRAYDSRTVINRTLKNLPALTAPESLDSPDVEEIKKKLLSLCTERDKLITAKVRAAGDAAAKRTRVDGINAKLAELATVILPMAEEKRLKEAAEDVVADENAGRIADQLRHSIASKHQQAVAIAKLGAKSECPTCARALTKKDVVELVAEMNTQIAALESQLKVAEHGASEYAHACEWREQIKRSIAACAEKELYEEELRGLEESQAPDTGGIDTQIEQLDARIVKGQDVLVKVSAFAEKIRQYNDTLSQRAKLEDELAVAQKLIDFAGPDGARKQAAAGKVGPFVESIRARAEHFGFELEMNINEPSYRVRTYEGAAWRPVEQLSESERFRLSVAFQVALAEVTGLNFVVIDRADMLDREGRRNLAAMLLASPIEQAIVCSTTNDPAPERVPEGVKFFRMSNDAGVTRILEPVEA